MISVVIPLYNKEKQIAGTLQSVLHQTYQDFEIIIVNDGSTDNSVSEVKKFNDSRIRLFNQKNSGVSSARNRGIKEAKGEHIAFLDADDEWDEDYLETISGLILKFPECCVFATNYRFKNKKGILKEIILHKIDIHEEGILDNYFEVASCSHPPLWTSAVCAKRNALLDFGGFPVGIKSGEDLLTWARLAVNHRIAYCLEPKASFIYDPSAFNEDQNKRMPESDDFVGEALDQLYHQNKSIIGLRQYVGLWHKMRARLYLEKNIKRRAIVECFKCMHYTINIKIFIFLMLSLLPHGFTVRIFPKLY